MEYFGREIKKLGFGLMRLPQKEGASDVEETKKMVDRFLEAGCTYFDTAWAYGDSEDTIRQALVERYPRDRYLLATKLAAWMDCKTRQEAEAQLETSLRRTGAGYFDFYLLHNLGENRTHFFEDYGIWDFVQEKKQEGKIRHWGFSFHSTPEELDTLLTQHPEAEFVQLQINYGDWDYPAIQSRACYEVARKHGKPVIIMEPVKGGMLANPPESVQAIFRQADPNRSYASWAIRFAASLEGVMTVLSGMSNMEQMEDNLSYMRDFQPLSPEEKAVIEKAQQALREIPLIPCTSCNYCAKVCPNNIGISGTFAAMNYLTLYRNREEAARKVQSQVWVSGHQPITACVQCGQCEEVCPQHISIREELVKVTKTFE